MAYFIFKLSLLFVVLVLPRVLRFIGLASDLVCCSTVKVEDSLHRKSYSLRSNPQCYTIYWSYLSLRALHVCSFMFEYLHFFLPLHMLNWQTESPNSNMLDECWRKWLVKLMQPNKNCQSALTRMRMCSSSVSPGSVNTHIKQRKLISGTSSGKENSKQGNFI